MALAHMAPVPTAGGVIRASMLGDIPILVGRVVGREATRTALSVPAKEVAHCNVGCADSEAFWCGRSSKSPFVPLRSGVSIIEP